MRVSGQIFGHIDGHNDESGEPDQASGFISTWRLLLDRLKSSYHKGYAAWLRAEVEKALSRSLGLALDIEYYYGSSSAETRLLSPPEARQLRDDFYNWLRINANSEVLARIVSDRKPLGLRQLIRREHIRDSAVIPFERWSWIGSIVLAGQHLNGGVVARQAGILFRSKYNDPQEIADWTPEITSEKATWIEWDLIELIFPTPSERKRLIELLAGMELPAEGLEAWARRDLEAVKRESLARLRSGATDARFLNGDEAGGGGKPHRD